MAQGDLTLAAGTALTWTSSGGDYTMTMSSVADTNGRAGAKGDLGATRAPLWTYSSEIKAGATGPSGTAPTYDFYWCSSPSATAATDNDGPDGVFTGSDVALTAPSAEELGGLLFIGSVPLTTTNDEIFRKTWVFAPPHRYGFPVFVNNSNQTDSTTGTDHSIVLTPQTHNVEP